MNLLNEYKIIKNILECHIIDFSNIKLTDKQKEVFNLDSEKKEYEIYTSFCRRQEGKTFACVMKALKNINQRKNILYLTDINQRFIVENIMNIIYLNKMLVKNHTIKKESNRIIFDDKYVIEVINILTESNNYYRGKKYDNYNVIVDNNIKFDTNRESLNDSMYINSSHNSVMVLL